MPDVEFRKIAVKAATEKSFFDALLKEPESALGGANIYLTPDELIRLKAALKGPGTVKVDFGKLFKMIYSNTQPHDVAECFRCCFDW
jgi:hypothetical protein